MVETAIRKHYQEKIIFLTGNLSECDQEKGGEKII